MAVVLDSKIRVNRNIRDFNFPSMLNNKDAQTIVNKVRDIAFTLGYEEKKIRNTSSIEKLELFENNIITGELLKNIDKSIVLLKDSSPIILVNEKDHIVIEKSRKELNLKDSFEEVMKIDDVFDNNISYIFDNEFGFLTSDPLKCGCAMTPSVTLHLPATVFFGILKDVKRLRAIGYNIEGIDEKTPNILGNIYVISPSRTIGKSEEEYIDKLNDIAIELMTNELENRKRLYLENIIDLEDMTKRSLGILSNARIIDEEEMMHHFSNVFLGLELGVLKSKTSLDLMETIKNFKNGHLQIERGSILDKKSRDILRANNIRKMIKEVF